MAYPFSARTRKRTYQSFKKEITQTVTSGTVTLSVQGDPGAYHVGVAVWVSGTDQDVVFKAHPYVNKAQTVVGSSLNVLPTGSTTAATLITVSSTSTPTGDVYSFVSGGDQYAMAAPIVLPYGVRVTVTTTATSGTWHVGYLAVEV